MALEAGQVQAQAVVPEIVLRQVRGKPYVS